MTGLKVQCRIGRLGWLAGRANLRPGVLDMTPLRRGRRRPGVRSHCRRPDRCRPSESPLTRVRRRSPGRGITSRQEQSRFRPSVAVPTDPLGRLVRIPSPGRVGGRRPTRPAMVTADLIRAVSRDVYKRQDVGRPNSIRLGRRGSHHRHRRAAQRGQVHPVQRAHPQQRPGGELPVRDHRAERRGGGGPG